MLNPRERFSRIKANLKPGEFDEIVNYEKIKELVLKNREIVMNSELAKSGDGIFRFPNFENIIRYMEQEHRAGVLTNASFSRPEANHPLVIGAFTLLNAEKDDLHPHVIFGFPGGSTELAIAQQYVFRRFTNFNF